MNPWVLIVGGNLMFVLAVMTGEITLVAGGFVLLVMSVASWVEKIT